MDMPLLLVSALALGAAYALVAVGFVLTLNAAGAVNFAHGDSVMLGGVAAVVLAGLAQTAGSSLPGLVLLPAVILLGAGLGLLIGALGFLPLKDRPPAAVFVATIAIASVFEQSATVFFGPAPRSAPPVWRDGVLQPLAMIAVAMLVLGAVYLVLERTQLGRRFRALAQDREMARALGIPAIPLVAAAFAAGGGLAGLAGALLGHQFLVVANQGPGYMLKAYIAVVIGGWGSVPGALAGALLIALFETFVAASLSAVWAQALLYVAVLLVLLLRPQGLFGEPAGRRA
jgi:branched-chain amino acid transport system permease protein